MYKLLSKFSTHGVMVLLATMTPACIVDSNCLDESDCSGWEQCNLTTGDCFLECGEDLDCPIARPLCFTEEFRCVGCMAGQEQACTDGRPFCLSEQYICVACLVDEDCEDGDECIDNSCHGDAPPIELIDWNTASPSFGDVVALSDLQGQLVLIYFAGLS